MELNWSINIEDFDIILLELTSRNTLNLIFLSPSHQKKFN